MTEILPEAREAADSGMTGAIVEMAEQMWANLPTTRPWTSLPTHEKALVCNTLNRAILAERERCARVGGDHADHAAGFATGTAQAIRSTDHD